MIIKLVRLLFIGGLIYILYRMLWKGEGWSFFKSKKKGKRTNSSYKTPTQIEEMKKDPVCGTYIPEHQAITYRNAKTTHYFCSEECKQKFISLNK